MTRPAVVVAMAATLAACTGPRLHVMEYSDHIVMQPWPPDLVDQFCSHSAGHWDSGKPRPAGAPVGGCFDSRPTIWVKHPMYRGHEDRHFDCWKHSKNPKCGEDPDAEGYAP